MARRKQIAPMQRINSGEVMQPLADNPEPRAVYTQMNGHSSPNPRQSLDKSEPTGSAAKSTPTTSSSSLTSGTTADTPSQSYLALFICVSGIYGSFLTWALLQERITTTPYLLSSSAQSETEYFRFPVVLNTIQSTLAFLSGSLYLLATQPTPTQKTSSFFLPSRAALPPLALVTLTSSLASPFGYASLAHVDYLTFVLAKSCKLLPVMFLHITLFRRRYPLSKYLIVCLVTSGVAVFTLNHPPKPGKPSHDSKGGSTSIYGLSLLSINLLFDGLTNTVQDHIFSSPARYGRISGPQMMVSLNFLSTLLTAAYLLLTPLIPTTFLPANFTDTTELPSALAFLSRHPAAWTDILGFCLCGAVGQLFIYATLERFSSLLLVTVTVTRKMLTMLLSVIWFGKSLSLGQWGGVGLVFGGIGGEAILSRKEKMEKDRRKREAAEDASKRKDI